MFFITCSLVFFYAFSTLQWDVVMQLDTSYQYLNKTYSLVYEAISKVDYSDILYKWKLNKKISTYVHLTQKLLHYMFLIKWLSHTLSNYIRRKSCTFYKFNYFLVAVETPLFFGTFIYTIYIFMRPWTTTTEIKISRRKNTTSWKIMVVRFNLTFRDSLFMDDVNYWFFS